MNKYTRIKIIFNCICLSLYVSCSSYVNEPEVPNESSNIEQFNQLNGELTVDNIDEFSQWFFTEGITSLLIGHSIYLSLLPAWQALVDNGISQANNNDRSSETKGWVRLTLPCHDDSQTQASLKLYNVFSTAAANLILWGDAKQCQWDEVSLNGSLHFETLSDRQTFMKVSGDVGYESTTFTQKLLYLVDDTGSSFDEASYQMSLLWNDTTQGLRWKVIVEAVQEDELESVDEFIIQTASSQWRCSLTALECQQLDGGQISANTISLSE
jgi:hypothetical protein